MEIMELICSWLWQIQNPNKHEQCLGSLTYYLVNSTNLIAKIIFSYEYVNWKAENEKKTKENKNK